MIIKNGYGLAFRFVLFEVIILLFCVLLSAFLTVSSGALAGYIHGAYFQIGDFGGEDDLGGGLIVALSMGVAFLVSIVASILLHVVLYKRYFRVR